MSFWQIMRGSSRLVRRNKDGCQNELRKDSRLKFSTPLTQSAQNTSQSKIANTSRAPSNNNYHIFTPLPYHTSFHTYTLSIMMNLFATTSLLLVSAAILFCLTSSSSAATASSSAVSSEHDVHILHRRRLNSKTSKALLFSKTSKAYDSTTAQLLSDTPASATQDTPTSSNTNNNNGSTNFYHPNVNKRFFMFSKGGKMFKSTKTLKQNHNASNKSGSTIDTSFPDTDNALSFSFSMSYDMSMSFDNNDGSDFFFLPDDVIQEFGRVVSKSGKSSTYRASSKSKTSSDHIMCSYLIM